ncbi:MAG: ribonuclease III [Hungatella sp.]|nr:ribonuclease III [Hungatella sp.]
MEESIKAERMNLAETEPAMYSPLVLAYLGDAVYELMIRSKVVRKGNTQVNKMHKKSASLVKAQTQASMIRLLEPDLTKEELAIFKRGRNAKSVTMAKHATMAEYRMATGMEALVGYLYLSEQFERLSELISLGLKKIEERET